MFFDKDFLDKLSEQAKQNPRLRQSYDLRTTPEDNSQRMLNALEPGTLMPIHRHRNTSETMVMVRGKLIERFYDEKGNITEERLMVNGEGFMVNGSSEESCSIVQIPAGQWHSLEVLESGTIIFEAKDGMYEPLGEEDMKSLAPTLH